jgi:low temperature requirement protein LtrA
VPGRPSNLAAPIGPDAHGVHSDVSGEHLLERFRLFFLIALGETLITTGSAFADEPLALGPVVAFVNSFAASVAIWFCYFQRAEGAGLRASETSEDASGVADERVIAHPGASRAPATWR